MASEFGGENIYKVNYEQIYCFVRDGKITMTMDYVLVEPVQLEDKIGRIYIESKKKAFMDAQEMLAALVTLENKIKGQEVIEEEKEDNNFKGGFSEKYARKK